MTPMFAQEQLGPLPDTFWKNFCIALLVLLGAVGAIVLIWSQTRKPDKTRLDDDPAINVRKAAKRYNHDAIDTRFVGIERQVAENTVEIDSLWTTMRAEDKATRDENARQFNEISRALGRIEGTLGTKP